MKLKNYFPISLFFSAIAANAATTPVVYVDGLPHKDGHSWVFLTTEIMTECDNFPTDVLKAEWEAAPPSDPGIDATEAERESYVQANTDYIAKVLTITGLQMNRIARAPIKVTYDECAPYAGRLIPVIKHINEYRIGE